MERDEMEIAADGSRIQRAVSIHGLLASGKLFYFFANMSSAMLVGRGKYDVTEDRPAQIAVQAS